MSNLSNADQAQALRADADSRRARANELDDHARELLRRDNANQCDRAQAQADRNQADRQRDLADLLDQRARALA